MASFEQPNLPVHQFPVWKKHFLHGTREWVEGNMKWEYGMDFDNVNLPYTCDVCKRGEICGVSLIRCKHCNVTHYCSEAHQKEGRAYHKLICKRIQSYATTLVNKAIPSAFVHPHDQESYQNFLTSSLLELTPLYKAQSTEWDRQKANSHWETQQHCQVCFKSPFLFCLRMKQGKGKETRKYVKESSDGKDLDPALEICSGCHSVSCCRSPSCQSRFKQLHSIENCEKYLSFYASKVLSMQFGSSPVMNCRSHVDTAFYHQRNLHRNGKRYEPENDSNRSNNEQQGTQLAQFSLPSSSSSPSSFIADWTEYFSLKMDSFELPAGLMQLPPVMGMLTDALSFPLTILWGLFRAYPLTDLLSMETIEIHVLGAEYAEATGATDKYEELLHWLPNCRVLTVVLTGPYISEVGSYQAEELCAACMDAGADDAEEVDGAEQEDVSAPHRPRSLFIHEVKGFYHDILQSTPDIANNDNISSTTAAKSVVAAVTIGEKRKHSHCEKSRESDSSFSNSDNDSNDVEEEEEEEEEEEQFVVRVENASLLICCHSGLHDTVSSDKFELSLRTTWRETVDAITAAGKPCVFTGYTTEEIIADAAVLEGWGCRVTVSPRVNPFRGLLAYPEVAHDNQFYYSNHSCLMIQGGVHSEHNIE